MESVSRKTFLSRSAFTSVSCFTLSTNSFVFLNSFQSCFFLFGEFSESKKISPFTQYRRRISYFPRSLIFSKYTTSEEYFRQIISTRICRVENSRKSYGSVREREGGAESGRVYVRSLAHLSTHWLLRHGATGYLFTSARCRWIFNAVISSEWLGQCVCVFLLLLFLWFGERYV